MDKVRQGHTVGTAGTGNQKVFRPRQDLSSMQMLVEMLD